MTPPPDGRGAAEHWQVLGRERVADYEIFRVERLRARSPRTGELFDRYRLNLPDWASVIAFDEEGRLVMVEQYRVGAELLSIEFPAGALEEGEDPAAAARRELREETGYEAADVRLVGRIHSDPAIHDNVLNVVLARSCRRVGAPALDDGEDVHVRLVAVEELKRMIAAGEIAHALAVTAWALYEATSTAEAG